MTDICHHPWHKGDSWEPQPGLHNGLKALSMEQHFSIRSGSSEPPSMALSQLPYSALDHWLAVDTCPILPLLLEFIVVLSLVTKV